MRFLHLADLHLDSPFASRDPELRKELRSAVLEAFERAVRSALEHEVDAVLIAGDLFDGEHLSLPSQRRLLQALGSLSEADVPVIYATGNHDPGGPGSLAGSLPWPASLHLVDTADPQTIEVRRGTEPVGAVTGAGHDGPGITADLSRSFPKPEGSLPHVGLLHTQVGGARSESEHHPYAPSDLTRLGRSGHAYWALGHIHVRQPLTADGRIQYAGNLQGRNPREVGAKGGLLVELAPSSPPQVTFVELARYRWERLRLEGEELAGESTLAGLARRLEEEWHELRRTDPGLPGSEWLVRVELAGPSPLSRSLRRKEVRLELEEDLAGALGWRSVQLRVSDVRSPIDPALHRDRSDVLGEALRLAEELQPPEGASPMEALGIEAHQLAGFEDSGSESRDEYLRTLLEGAEHDLAERLLGGDA